MENTFSMLMPDIVVKFRQTAKKERNWTVKNMPNVFNAADTIIIRIQNKKEF